MPIIHTPARRRLTRLAILVLFIIPSACSYLGGYSSFQRTLIALAVQQTVLARTQVAFTQIAQALLITPPPVATHTPQPTLAVPTPETGSPATLSLPTPDPVLERRLKAAKILLFEDMSASHYIRYVKTALDEGGYFYLDVGSAKGWFKTQLLSSEDWDLVIAAAEARRDFGGEFFGYINDRLVKGSAAIIEYGGINSAPTGQVDALLSRCGVKFQLDWYEPDLRVFFWLVPDNSIFHEPNEVPSLANAAHVWTGDIGDLLEIDYQDGKPTGDAVLLAGTNPTWKTDHGLLVNCLGGRLTLQTFASHEYRYTDMVSLWQNYIYQALKSRFAVRPLVAPTPAPTMPPITAVPTSSSGGSQPGYGSGYPCGDQFKGRILSPPYFRKDLFEHHADGSFLVVKLQLVNLTAYPIQIWDDDYSVEGLVDGKPFTFALQKAATGFLYNDMPTHLVQDLIDPGISWSTSLAFDVDPGGKDWVLVVRPGSEVNAQVCEMRIPLNP